MNITISRFHYNKDPFYGHHFQYFTGHCWAGQYGRFWDGVLFLLRHVAGRHRY